MAAELAEKHNGRINENESEVFEFMASLKACTVRKALDEGCRIHALIVKKGLLERSPHLGSFKSQRSA